MKDDMITLVKQLQESEARANHLAATTRGRHASGGGAATATSAAAATTEPLGRDTGRVNPADFDKIIKSKDEKVRGYRQIIVRLKEEFIKAEEERALEIAKIKNAAGKRAADGDGAPNITVEDMRDMKVHIKELKEGLVQAREEVERARRSKEKLAQERDMIAEQYQKTDAHIRKLQTELQAAQESQARVKHELEESKRKEARLREKLKEVMGTGDGGGKMKEGIKVRHVYSTYSLCTGCVWSIVCEVLYNLFGA